MITKKMLMYTMIMILNDKSMNIMTMITIMMTKIMKLLMMMTTIRIIPMIIRRL